MLLCTSLVNAQVPKSITAWTDKSPYNPGEPGKLYIALHNHQDSAITITKVEVTFEAWRAFVNGAWEGNKTIEVNKALTSGETYLIETDFIVPTDGRAIITLVEIKAYTKEVGVLTLPRGEFYIRVSAAPPSYMTQIVSLFTIQVALMIVCTVIITATIFLSTRRPKTVWREEEEKTSSQSAQL